MLVHVFGCKNKTFKKKQCAIFLLFFVSKLKNSPRSIFKKKYFFVRPSGEVVYRGVFLLLWFESLCGTGNSVSRYEFSHLSEYLLSERNNLLPISFDIDDI